MRAMGLLSRPAVEADATGKTTTESRWLFPLKRFEEELLEHILISTSGSAPWSGRRGNDSASNVKERPMKNLVQRKFENFGKNVAVKVQTLKHAFSETHEKAASPDPAGFSRDECRKVACNEIVRATLHRHPGSQLPDVFVSTLQSHFDALPSSYARAGFNSEQVFMHIRLLEQARLQLPNQPAIHLQAADHLSRSSDVSELSSTTSSPSSSVWEETGRALADEVIDVAFACSSIVSKPALVWVFEHEMVSVRQATVFERKGVSLGVLTIQSSREKAQQEFIGRVIKSAIRKSRFSKFSLGLCGCEVPAFAEQQRDSTTKSSRKESPVSSGDELCEFKENYWNEADFNFTSTSFVNSGYEYGSYGYPCYGLGPSTPGGIFRILVAEGARPEIISGEEELGRWVLGGTELLLDEEISSPFSEGVRKGYYKGEAVFVREIKGVKGVSVLEGEFRRDVIALASKKHKNLIPFCGLSVDSRHSSYIATVWKFVEGGSLRSFIRNSPALQLCDLLRIARDIAEGLRFLHEHGVVHRDLRSSRVMIDESGTAMVGDLEVARLWNNVVEGTPDCSNHQWMALEAPEAVRADSVNRTVSGKSDVYDYGLLLWEMLTGELPFENISPVQPAVSGAVEGLRLEIPEGAFPPLKCLIQHCWASDPLDRPDFSEVLEVLDMAMQELLSSAKS